MSLVQLLRQRELVGQTLSINSFLSLYPPVVGVPPDSTVPPAEEEVDEEQLEQQPPTTPNNADQQDQNDNEQQLDIIDDIRFAHTIKMVVDVWLTALKLRFRGLALQGLPSVNEAMNRLKHRVDECSVALDELTEFNLVYDSNAEFSQNFCFAGGVEHLIRLLAGLSPLVGTTIQWSTPIPNPLLSEPHPVVAEPDAEDDSTRFCDSIINMVCDILHEMTYAVTDLARNLADDEMLLMSLLTCLRHRTTFACAEMLLADLLYAKRRNWDLSNNSTVSSQLPQLIRNMMPFYLAPFTRCLMALTLETAERFQMESSSGFKSFDLLKYRLQSCDTEERNVNIAFNNQRYILEHSPELLSRLLHILETGGVGYPPSAVMYAIEDTDKLPKWPLPRLVVFGHGVAANRGVTNVGNGHSILYMSFDVEPEDRHGWTKSQEPIRGQWPPLPPWSHRSAEPAVAVAAASTAETPLPIVSPIIQPKPHFLAHLFHIVVNWCRRLIGTNDDGHDGLIASPPSSPSPLPLPPPLTEEGASPATPPDMTSTLAWMRAAVEEARLNSAFQLYSPTRWNSGVAIEVARRRSDVMTFLYMLLSGPYKRHLQYVMAYLGLIPVMLKLFDSLFWDSRVLPYRPHGENCNCDPEGNVKIHLLHLCHNFCDRETPNEANKALFFTARDQARMEEFRQEKTNLTWAENQPFVRIIPLPDEFGEMRSGMPDSIHQGLAWRFAAALIHDVESTPSSGVRNSSLRFWLCAMVEALLRGSSLEMKSLVASWGVLSALADSLIAESQRPYVNETVLQSGFDLLGELCKGNPLTMGWLSGHMAIQAKESPCSSCFGVAWSPVRFHQLYDVACEHLVEGNVFLRSLFLTLDRFFQIPEAVWLIPWGSGENVEASVRALWDVVDLEEASQENLCCTNTAIAFLTIKRKRDGVEAFESFVKSDQSSSAAKSNFRKLLWFWRCYYSCRALDRVSLQNSAGLDFSLLEETVDLLCDGELLVCGEDKVHIDYESQRPFRAVDEVLEECEDDDDRRQQLRCSTTATTAQCLMRRRWMLN